LLARNIDLTAFWVAAIGCGTYSSIMFRWVNHNLRVRGAIWLVAIYAFCVVAPPVALAVTNGALSPHCISKDRSDGHSMHADSGTMTEVGNSADEQVEIPFGVQHKGKQSKSKICCGMLCISAITSEFSTLFPRHFVSSFISSLDRYLVGVEVGLLNPPPIAL
jgi:hypothetical protein